MTSLTRQRRIVDLTDHALKLARDNSQTPDSIYNAVLEKAKKIGVSEKTAKEYRKEVFERIDKLR